MEVYQAVRSRQERVSVEAEATAARVMGQLNVLAWQLVEMLVEVIAAEAWGPGGGLRSPKHWLCWRTGLSSGRAERLVRIARRVPDLPACVALFRAGLIGEDAMGLIARKAPAGRDQELADLAPDLLHSQLSRILQHLPDQEPGPGPAATVERRVHFGFRPDGQWEAQVVLPPDEGARAQRALEAARGELFHERQNDDGPEVRGRVTWADAFGRLCQHALDGLDPDTARGRARGERAQVLVHLDARHDGDGQARLHLGPQLPDPLRRYLCCDAKVRAVLEDHTGAVLGITPRAATVHTRLRSVIEQRDGGCRYPGCSQTRWVHVHHLTHRQDGGLTVARNLCCLCPFHHRQHHQGAFTIHGDPQQPTGLRFVDHWGHDIGPPRLAPVTPPSFGSQPAFKPPTGEPLHDRWFGWN